MKTRYERIVNVISHCYHADKILFIEVSLLSVVHAGMVLGEAIVPSFFINSLQKAKNVTDLWVPSLSLLIYIVISSVINGFANMKQGVLWDSTSGYNNRQLIYASTKKRPEFWLNVEKLNERQKAVDGAEAASFVACIYISVLMFYVPAAISLFVFYSKINPLIPFMVLLSIMPAIYLNRKKEKKYECLAESLSESKRCEKEYKKTLATREFAKEIRTNCMFGQMFDNWVSVYDEIIGKKNAVRRSMLSVSVLCNVVSALAYVLMLYYLYIGVINSTISVGTFVAVITSVSSLSFLMDEMINNNLLIVSENVGSIDFFRNYVKEISDENAVTDYLGEDSKNVIELKNVSFCYPGSDIGALNDISLCIKSGENVVIVGENGSGKTTLSKIILGIYSPSSGHIYVENVEKFLKHESISMVSQDYVRYLLTCEENINISDCDKKDSVVPYIQRTEICGIGLTDQLGVEFGGKDLSIGNWQRISIARGLYRSNNVLVFDEPTSAIDPNEEARIYDLIKDESKGKTYIIVSHRMGFAIAADKVIVMKGGSIVGIGRHVDLYKNNDYYRTLFDSQKKWYIQRSMLECR